MEFNIYKSDVYLEQSELGLYCCNIGYKAHADDERKQQLGRDWLAKGSH